MAKEYEVEIGLYEDAMTPTIQALILEQEGGSIRLTSAKGCGTWNMIRKFKCYFTSDDLRSADLRSRRETRLTTDEQ